MAQDFHAVFGFGQDDKHIALVDADGVALAAIQALHQIIEEKNAEIAILQARLNALEAVVLELAGGQGSNEQACSPLTSNRASPAVRPLATGER
jgi:hypothetical protein